MENYKREKIMNKIFKNSQTIACWCKENNLIYRILNFKLTTYIQIIIFIKKIVSIKRNCKMNYKKSKLSKNFKVRKMKKINWLNQNFKNNANILHQQKVANEKSAMKDCQIYQVQ